MKQQSMTAPIVDNIKLSGWLAASACRGEEYLNQQRAKKIRLVSCIIIA